MISHLSLIYLLLPPFDLRAIMKAITPGQLYLQPDTAVFSLNGKPALLKLFLKGIFFSIKKGDFSTAKNLMVVAASIVTKPVYAILADDDEDDQEFFRETVEKVASYVNLKMAANGEELMHILNTSDILPHIVFLDLNMPVKSGLECLKEIRGSEKLKHIPVIIYTTSASKEQIDKTYNQGADLYITKPESFRELKLITQRVFEMDWKGSERPRKDKFVLKA